MSSNFPVVAGWMRLPQRTLLRKAIFQIHLWAGLLLGLYISVVCISGSAVVFRNDIYEDLSDKLKVAEQGKLLDPGELTRAVEAHFPGYVMRDYKPGRDGLEATEVKLSRNGNEIER